MKKNTSLILQISQVKPNLPKAVQWKRNNFAYLIDGVMRADHIVKHMLTVGVFFGVPAVVVVQSATDGATAHVGVIPKEDGWHVHRR
jgi:hypothetical protein